MEDDRDESCVPPLQLYEIAIEQLSTNIRNESLFKEVYLKKLPGNVLFDLCCRLAEYEAQDLLCGHFSNVDTFARFLHLPYNKVRLLRFFHITMDTRATATLVRSYINKCTNLQPSERDKMLVINTGLQLATFFNDSGCYSESVEILKAVRKLCLKYARLPQSDRKLFECYHKLLHAQIYYRILEANRTVKLIVTLIEKLQNSHTCPNTAALYAEISFLYYTRAEFAKAYEWTEKALQQVNENLSASVVIDIMRYASLACIGKREFRKAEMLIVHAMHYAYEMYPQLHPKMADVLLNFGYYYLNTDYLMTSFSMYAEALGIREHMFGRRYNLKMAEAHADLAYASYIEEVRCSLTRSISRKHIENAMTIWETLLPDDHITLAIGKCIKALILEKLTFDLQGAVMTRYNEFTQKGSLLNEAEQLHLSALIITMHTYGEDNVQTGRVYGNLGRLYQLKLENDTAEDMYLRSIAIKTATLGPNDIEVGNTVGCLALLCSFQEGRRREAADLYKRSIAISIHQFGDGFSGLESDYRGLINIYSIENDTENKNFYINALHRWKEQRGQLIREEDVPLLTPAPPLSETVRRFFNN